MEHEGATVLTVPAEMGVPSAGGGTGSAMRRRYAGDPTRCERPAEKSAISAKHPPDGRIGRLGIRTTTHSARHRSQRGEPVRMSEPGRGWRARPVGQSAPAMSAARAANADT